jgi:hypothetical protein
MRPKLTRSWQLVKRLKAPLGNGVRNGMHASEIVNRRHTLSDPALNRSVLEDLLEIVIPM